MPVTPRFRVVSAPYDYIALPDLGSCRYAIDGGTGACDTLRDYRSTVGLRYAYRCYRVPAHRVLRGTNHPRCRTLEKTDSSVSVIAGPPVDTVLCHGRRIRACDGPHPNPPPHTPVRVVTPRLRPVYTNLFGVTLTPPCHTTALPLPGASCTFGCMDVGGLIAVFALWTLWRHSTTRWCRDPAPCR